MLLYMYMYIILTDCNLFFPHTQMNVCPSLVSLVSLYHRYSFGESTIVAGTEMHMHGEVTLHVV